MSQQLALFHKGDYLLLLQPIFPRRRVFRLHG